MNKFIQFLSLNTLFKKAPSEQELQIIAIQKQADNLLAHQTYSTFFQLVNNGYQITPAQEKKLQDDFIRSVRNNTPYAANNMVADGYYMSDEALAVVFFDMTFNIQYGAIDDQDKFKDISIQVEERIYDPVCLQALFKEWKKNIDRYTGKWDIPTIHIEASSLSHAYHYFKESWFEDISVEDYQALLGNIKRAIDYNSGIRLSSSEDRVNHLNNIFHDMNKNFSSVFNQQTNALIEQTKNLYLSERVDKIVAISSAEQSKHYHVKNLPENAQTIINDLEKNYLRIHHNTDKVSQENMFTINKMMDERLPEIVRKYFSIDEEYRTSLKNHDGKHAGDLLIDSLSQLHEMMQGVVVSINEDKLTKMTVDARYMNAVKKGF